MRRWRWIALVPVLGLLLACGQEPSSPTPPPPPADPPSPAAEAPSAQRLAADSAAAQAPFGMLRIAPLGGEGAPAPEGLTFRHARTDSAADLVLTVATRRGQSPAGPEVPRWSASPGRLVGALTARGLLAEVTSSPRVALYRLSVMPGDPVVVRVAWRAPGGGEAVLTPARGRQALTGSLVTPDGAQLHLALRFDRTFRLLPPPDRAARPRQPVSQSIGTPLELEFQPSNGVVRVRMALSTVDVAGARANLRELPGWDYDAALASVRTAWDDVLGRLQLETRAGRGAAAAAPGQNALRAALYRVLAHYGDITDSDGRYRAADGSVRRMPAGRSHIGNLDLAREHGALLPLLDLLAPERAADVAETLLAHQVATGRLPSRTAWGREAGRDAPHAPLLALAGMVSRSTPGIDPARALPPMVKPDQLAGGEPAWNGTLALGRRSGDDDGLDISLKNAWAYHAVALVAAARGDRAVASAYAARAVLYRQLWKDAGGAFRPGARRSGRASTDLPDRSGPGTAPASEPCAAAFDAQPWVPGRFDIDGLLRLLGGRQALADALTVWLDDASDCAERRPSSPVPAFVPWLYGFSNHPEQAPRAVAAWRAAALEREADPATAAALLFSALGLFPVLDTAGEYVLGRPAVSRATIRRADDTVAIEVGADDGGSSAGTIWLDGIPLPGRTLPHRRLVEGGVLRFGAPAADRVGPDLRVPPGDGQ